MLFTVAIVCVAAWGLVRATFFVGWVGSDDLYYLRYAVHGGTPANDWEARLVGNGLTAVCLALFGWSEVVACLPSLAASFVVLLCAVCGGWHFGGWKGALIAGGTLAVLPLDVDLATSVSPHTVMSAFMAAGTLSFMGSPESTRARWVSAALLGMGFITHFAGIYYIAALSGASVIVDRRRFQPTVMAVALGCGLALLADMLAFHVLFGDAILRFRLCMSELATGKPTMPLLPDGSFNPEFVTWPLLHLLYSKALGPVLILVVAWGAVRFRQLDCTNRVLWLGIVLLWGWMSFGSQVPWVYAPFWRMSRFLQPLTLAVVLLLSTLTRSVHRSLLRHALVALVPACCLLNLSLAGPWGQNVEISRELLQYAHWHPDRRFVTDYHTLNEMYAAEGMRTVSNVGTLYTSRPSRLLDPQAIRLSCAQGSIDAILVNPANLARTSVLDELVSRHGGEIRYETAFRRRRLLEWIGLEPDGGWALRKPRARVVTFHRTRPKGLSCARAPVTDRAE